MKDEAPTNPLWAKTARKVLIKMEVVSQQTLPCFRKVNAGPEATSEEKDAALKKALTGQNTESKHNKGMCSRLLPNWIVLVWRNVTSKPSLEGFTISLVRNLRLEVECEVGSMEPNLERVWKRNKLQAQTAE